MSDLKTAILDAKYIDMIALADFVVQDCGLPDFDNDGTPLPQQNEVAAAIFRWAAMQDRPAGAAALPSGSVTQDQGGQGPVDAPMENMQGDPGSQTLSGPSNWPNTGTMPNQSAQGEN